jgi:hypothetical protein
VILLPVKTLVSTAKSPSGSSGMNSPPIRESNRMDMANNPKEKAMTVLGKRSNLLKFFWWIPTKKSIILSDQFLLCSVFLLKNNALIIGM